MSLTDTFFSETVTAEHRAVSATFFSPLGPLFSIENSGKARAVLDHGHTWVPMSYRLLCRKQQSNSFGRLKQKEFI